MCNCWDSVYHCMWLANINRISIVFSDKTVNYVCIANNHSNFQLYKLRGSVADYINGVFHFLKQYVFTKINFV